MGAIAGCAASAAEATGSLSAAFVASYLAAKILLLVLHVRAWIHVSEPAAPWVCGGLARHGRTGSVWAWAGAVEIDALTTCWSPLQGWRS